MIEHCVSTFNLTQTEDAFKAYLCEILRGMAKQWGLEVRMGYFEVIDSLKPQEYEEPKDPAEVIGALKAKADSIRGN